MLDMIVNFNTLLMGSEAGWEKITLICDMRMASNPSYTCIGCCTCTSASSLTRLRDKQTTDWKSVLLSRILLLQLLLAVMRSWCCNCVAVTTIRQISQWTHRQSRHSINAAFSLSSSTAVLTALSPPQMTTACSIIDAFLQMYEPTGCVWHCVCALAARRNAQICHCQSSTCDESWGLIKKKIIIVVKKLYF